jgi:pimeloyl-ACP methyl ester carboxylesterase
MPRSKPQIKPVAHPARTTAAPPTVSARWLLSAIGIVAVVAALSAWAVLCLLFWQGSWQLLYHPGSAVTRTPANAGLAFDPVGFAPADTGAPQLQGWWIPAAATPRYTVLYLHGQDGNLANAVDDLARLHSAGLNVLAFDYRGYGQSLFDHPSEARWRQDAEWALQYLTRTRHVDPRTIVLDGSALGANLALEIAAAHPELGGVVLESPLDAPVNAIFADPRARLVPAHLLISDRFDTNAPAASLRIPSLWFLQNSPQEQSGSVESSKAFQKVTATKTRIWITPSSSAKSDFENALLPWLDDLNRQR